MAAPERVIIDRRGERYAILPDQFDGFYKESGFSIVSWEDGTDYDTGKAPPSNTKADLIEQGLAIGAPVDESMTKAKIVEAIEARQHELAAESTPAPAPEPEELANPAPPA